MKKYSLLRISIIGGQASENLEIETIICYKLLAEKVEDKCKYH